MYKIIFVCLGNICRSPMAEYILKDLLKKKGLAECFSVCSRATSDEEEGNPVYPPARRELFKHGIACEGKRAEVLTERECEESDILVCMEESNVRKVHAFVGKDGKKKVKKLLDFADTEEKDIADPYYSGDFEGTFRQIYIGCESLLNTILKGENNA